MNTAPASHAWPKPVPASIARTAGPASSIDTSLISAQCAQNAVTLASSDTLDAMRSVATRRRAMPRCHADSPRASQWLPSSAPTMTANPVFWIATDTSLKRPTKPSFTPSP